MATLYITEYADIRGNASFVPPVAEQAVVFTTSTQSAAFNANTRFVRLHTDAICSIQFGENPTATTGHARMAINQTEYFAVRHGKATADKVAVVTNT